MDVTRQDCATLDEMIASAKRSEQSLIQGRGARASAISHVAEVAPQPSLAHSQAQAMAKDYIDAYMAEISKVTSGKGGQGNPSKKNKGRPKIEITCFFCGKIGHYSNDCSVQKYEWEAGKWHPTVQDRAISKEDYERLPKEERQRGRLLFGSSLPSAVAAAGPTIGFLDRERAYQAYMAGNP